MCVLPPAPDLPPEEFPTEVRMPTEYLDDCVAVPPALLLLLGDPLNRANLKGLAADCMLPPDAGVVGVLAVAAPIESPSRQTPPVWLPSEKLPFPADQLEPVPPAVAREEGATAPAAPAAPACQLLALAVEDDVAWACAKFATAIAAIAKTNA